MMITTGVGSPGAIGAVSGGRVFAINTLGTTPVQILPRDPERVSFTIHNPGSVDAFVAPSQQAQTGLGDVSLTPSTVALGGCFRVFANGGTLKVEGECQKAWQAFSASGSGNPLTVMVSRI